MKAITLYQPWATLVVLGEKKIETRSWYTGHRGNILIHASKKYTREHKRIAGSGEFLFALQSHGIYDVNDLPTGAIVGMVEVKDCLEMHTERSLPPDEDKYKALMIDADVNAFEKAFGIYKPGRFAWMLEGPEKFSKPYPAKGWQRLWNCDLKTA